MNEMMGGMSVIWALVAILLVVLIIWIVKQIARS